MLLRRRSSFVSNLQCEWITLPHSIQNSHYRCIIFRVVLLLSNAKATLDAVGRRSSFDAHLQLQQIVRSCLILLSQGLYSLSNAYSELGHREDAQHITEEVVILRCQLAADSADPDLAASLVNCYLNTITWKVLSMSSKRVQKTVQLYRRLAADHPAIFNFFLAISLRKLASNLFRFGHKQGILDASEEAVKIFRQLIANHSATHTLGPISIMMAEVHLRLGMEL